MRIFSLHMFTFVQTDIDSKGVKSHFGVYSTNSTAAHINAPKLSHTGVPLNTTYFRRCSSLGL